MDALVTRSSARLARRMADCSPTVGELFKAKAVTDEQLNAAVNAYLSDLEASAFPIADGYVVDLDAAIAEHFGVTHGQLKA